MKWSTALVEPPRTTIRRMAFSKALRVMISDGLISFSNRMRIYLPVSKHSFFFSSDTAGLEDEYGRLIPKASIAEAIVLAVYIPPQAPAPGQVWRMTPS